MTDIPLHPRQVSQLKDTRAGLEGMLSAPPYIRNQLQDGGAGVVKQVKHIDQMLKQAPVPIPPEGIDSAVSREKQLRESWLQGMPTQTEMRRNPPGATDKNMAWNRAHKSEVLEWKKLRRELHASGISEHRLADEGDVSNIEMYRPNGGPGEMNMDNAQISGAVQFGPKPGAGPAVVFTDADVEFLKTSNPDVHARLPLLTNGERQIVKDFLGGLTTATAGPSVSFSEVLEEVTAHLPSNLTIDPVDAAEPKRKPMTEERKDQLRANLVKGRETARLNREAKKQEG